jgi:hypothetical protein
LFAEPEASDQPPAVTPTTAETADIDARSGA